MLIETELAQSSNCTWGEIDPQTTRFPDVICGIQAPLIPLQILAFLDATCDPNSINMPYE